MGFADGEHEDAILRRDIAASPSLTRAVEILGGIAEFKRLMTEEFAGRDERWSRNRELLGRVLHAHLYVEHDINIYLRGRNPHLGDFEQLSFAHKLRLMGVDPVVEALRPGIARLNAIRNRFAHRLEAEVTGEDAAVFLADVYFVSIQNTLSPPPSGDIRTLEPIDVLERFAQFAGSRLSGQVSRLSQAIKQAGDELAGRA